MDHLLVDEFKEINQLPDLCVPCVHTNVPCVLWASLVGSDGKESACNSGDPSFIPGSGRSPGEGNGNPLHLQHGVARVGHSLATKSPNHPQPGEEAGSRNSGGH